MALVQRKTADSADAQQSFYRTSSLVPKERRARRSRIFLINAVVLTLLVAAFPTYKYQIEKNFYAFADDPSVEIQYDQNKNPFVIVNTYCEDPDDPAEVWATLEGDTFLNIKLTEVFGKRRWKSWTGPIDYLPMKGKYTLKTFTKKGCGTDVTVEVESIEFVGATETTSTRSGGGETFAEGTWVRSSIIQNDVDVDESESFPYIWSDPSKALSHSIKEEEWITYDVDGSARKILKNGVVTDENGFYEFNQLGNYELVCWIGSQSAEQLRIKFLSLRPQLFPNQRPFKFHLYPSTSLTSPDAKWDEEMKKRFRKCKNIIVSMDELDSPLSQVEYRDQFTKFIQHLLTAINDETFHIWIMTNMQSHSMVEATTENGSKKNCYRDYRDRSSSFVPMTSEHPCNEILKMLFELRTFPERVHLVDNTDLSLPYRYEVKDAQKHLDQISALVALRTFVFIGKQVKAWRDVGQRGHVNGLTRSAGVEEPNFELLPYDWSSNPKPLEK